MHSAEHPVVIGWMGERRKIRWPQLPCYLNESRGFIYRNNFTAALQAMSDREVDHRTDYKYIHPNGSTPPVELYAVFRK